MPRAMLRSHGVRLHGNELLVVSVALLFPEFDGDFIAEW